MRARSTTLIMLPGVAAIVAAIAAFSACATSVDDEASRLLDGGALDAPSGSVPDGSPEFGRDASSAPLADGAPFVEGSASDTGFSPAAHAPFPQIPNNGGRILANPQLVTVTFADYPYESDVQAFGDWIVTSNWLTTVGQEYGVGAGQQVQKVVLNDVLPASVLPADVEQLLEERIADGSLPAPPGPDSDFVYVVYFPSSTKTYVSAGAAYCTGWHLSFDLARDGGAITVPYAAIATGCNYRPPGESELQDVEQEASHEIIEAATDPIYAAPAYLIVDSANPWHYLDGEVGDLCVSKTLTLSGFEVQRIWSNSAASSGEVDPCQPNPTGAPFYGTSTASADDVAVAAGQSTTFSITAWSSAPLAAWSIVPVAAYNSGDFQPGVVWMSAPVNLGAASAPSLQVSNGDTTSVTLSVPPGTPSGAYGAIAMYSSANGSEWSMEPVLVHVP
jgi:hypothetical protein